MGLHTAHTIKREQDYGNNVDASQQTVMFSSCQTPGSAASSSAMCHSTPVMHSTSHPLASPMNITQSYPSSPNYMSQHPENYHSMSLPNMHSPLHGSSPPYAPFLQLSSSNKSISVEGACLEEMCDTTALQEIKVDLDTDVLKSIIHLPFAVIDKVEEKSPADNAVSFNTELFLLHILLFTERKDKHMIQLFCGR